MKPEMHGETWLLNSPYRNGSTEGITVILHGESPLAGTSDFKAAVFHLTIHSCIILSATRTTSSVRLFHMMAGTVTLTVIPVYHESGYTHFVQCTAINIMSPETCSFDSDMRHISLTCFRS